MVCTCSCSRSLGYMRRAAPVPSMHPGQAASTSWRPRASWSDRSPKQPPRIASGPSVAKCPSRLYKRARPIRRNLCRWSFPPAAMPSIVTPPLPAESAGGCNMTSGAPNFMPRRNPFSSSLARLSMPPSVRSWTAVTFSSLSPAKPTRTHRRQIGDVGDARMVSSFFHMAARVRPPLPQKSIVSEFNSLGGGRGTLHTSDIAKCGASGQTDVTRRDKLIASPQPASGHVTRMLCSDANGAGSHVNRM